MEDKVFNVEITGVKPLLMHSTRAMLQAPKNSRGGKPTPEEDAKLSLYVNKAGEPILPADSILGALKASAVDFRVPGKGKKSFKNYVDSGLEIVPEDPLVISNAGWAIDLRPVVVNRARIVRSRPRFDDWKVKFGIKVIDAETFIDPSDSVCGGGATIKDILSAAGKFKGMGDFRPRFGRFVVSAFEPAP